MRTLKIALYHNLPSGGARRAVYEMTKGLALRGHTIDEFCPASADLGFLSLHAHVRRTTVVPFSRGTPVGRIPMLTPYINAARLTCDLIRLARVEGRVIQEIDRGDYDLVFSHDCQLSQNPSVPGRVAIPAVHYCHHGAGSLLPSGRDDEGSRGWVEDVKRVYYGPARRVYPWLCERRAAHNIRQAKQVLANSCFAREGLYRAYGIEGQLCYLGVDVRRFRPLGLSRESFVLSVGAVHYNKGYRFLIRALSLIPKAHRPALIIAANGSEPRERQAVERLASSQGVCLSVQRIMDDEELVRLYNRASAFVYTPIMEPFGLALLEAMACGVPVVAVREGGIRELVVDGETGVLVDRDEGAFAEAVDRILKSERYADRLGEAASTNVQRNWAWERTVDRLERIFAWTIDKTP